MFDLMACSDCRAFYLKIKDSLRTAAEEISDENYSKYDLTKSYITGYHESGHDEDYALKEDPNG